MVSTRGGNASSREPPSKKRRELSETDVVSVLTAERDQLRSECIELRTRLRELEDRSRGETSTRERLKGMIMSLREELYDIHKKLKHPNTVVHISTTVTPADVARVAGKARLEAKEVLKQERDDSSRLNLSELCTRPEP